MKNKNRIIVMSILSYYARQIFDKTKMYEFRLSPIKKECLNKKIYIYSAKEDKAIIGYIKFDEVLRGNTEEIIKLTGYDKRKDKDEIIRYYGKNNKNCYAMHVSEVVKFNKSLTLKEMRNIDKNVSMPQYMKYIYEDNRLYNIIKSYDK